MFDELLYQLYTLWPARRSFFHKKHEVDRPLRSDFSGMATYERLEATSRTSYLHCVANQLESAPISWQLPLPYDIIFYMVNSYLLDVLPTLYSLSRTCKSLAALCRPINFRTITINKKAGYSISTPCEKLAALLSESPDIIDYIQNLYLLDRDMLYLRSSTITIEEESLCYILSRRYPKLKRLEIAFHVPWLLLLPQVQRAFTLVFSLPSLQTISLEHMRIPVDLVSYLQSIHSLEMRCEVSPPCGNDAYPNTYCTPKMLKYYDLTKSGNISQNIFLANSALLLSKLEYLEVYALARHLRFIQPPFQNCYRTLTTLKIYSLHEILNEAPPLDLKSLADLKSLVLYADISRAMYMDDTLQGVDRIGFMWMLDTLRTCRQPNSIENVEIVIETNDLVHTKQCPWEEMEIVLRPGVGWQHLKELHIRHNEQELERVYYPRYEGKYTDGYADSIILPKMLVLASMISVQFSLSHFPSIRRGQVYV